MADPRDPGVQRAARHFKALAAVLADEQDAAVAVTALTSAVFHELARRGVPASDFVRGLVDMGESFFARRQAREPL